MKRPVKYPPVLEGMARTGFQDLNDLAALRKMGHVPDEKRLVFYTEQGGVADLKGLYRGGHLFMVLAGPSAAKAPLHRMGERGILTMCVNNSWVLTRPNLWVGIDHPGRFVEECWFDPGILKFVPLAWRTTTLRHRNDDGSFENSGRMVKDCGGVLYFRRNEWFRPDQFLTEPSVNWGCHKGLTDEVGIISNRSTMLSAIRLAAHLGFAHVYLVGADFRMELGKQNYAFEQDRKQQAVKNNNKMYAALNVRLAALLPLLNKARTFVWNCTPDSGLKAFPYLDVERAIRRATRRTGRPLNPEGWYDRNADAMKAEERAAEEAKRQRQ